MYNKILSKLHKQTFVGSDLCFVTTQSQVEIGVTFKSGQLAKSVFICITLPLSWNKQMRTISLQSV